MNEKIKCIAEDSLEPLSKQIYQWAGEGLHAVEITVQDLVLLLNQLEDCEGSLYGTFETEGSGDRSQVQSRSRKNPKPEYIPHSQSLWIIKPLYLKLMKTLCNN